MCFKAQTQPERDAIATTGPQILSSIEEMPKKQLSFWNKKQQKNFELLCNQEIYLPQNWLQEEILKERAYEFKYIGFEAWILDNSNRQYDVH